MNKMALLEEYKMGPSTLKNRMVMSPMTRCRAVDNNTPNDLMAHYYEQRVSAGLIITEATQVSPQGVGYPFTPGIHSKEQVEGWKKITERVHKHGGKIFQQLWHVGRISHPDFHGGELPVAPSAVKPKGQVFTFEGLKDFVTPRELTGEEITAIINDYRQGAVNAKEAGFDGVEVHGANGYLIDQFLTDGTNRRDDEYGGAIENRSRFLFQVMDAVTEIWPEENAGIRLSPSGIVNDIFDSNPRELFSHVMNRLNEYPLAYIHLVEPMMPLDSEVHAHYPPHVLEYFGELYKGTIITNSGYTRESGNKVISSNRAQLVSYGKMFLANPDLPKRFELGSKLNEADTKTFYAGGEKGYIDYPFLG